MKIVNDEKNKKSVDLDLLIEEAFQKYEAVFFSEIENVLFIYRPLGRKEYKDIYNNTTLSDLDKQDAICKTVLVYPKDFDFDDCDAGIPNKLFEEVFDKSCLDLESTYHLLNVNREEAEQLGSEMTCIIAEAFPAYTIDEIESWNNFKFMKIYAQAEWILTNIRGIEFKIDIADYIAQAAGIEVNDYLDIEPEPQVQYEENIRPKTVNYNNQGKEKANASPSGPGKGMSAEQMAAYQDFIRQHPEFADAMQYDAAFTGMETMSADITNPALRPGWYHNH